jgi:hypothetical protein
MSEKIAYVLIGVALVAGLVIGSLWFKGCMVEPCPEIEPTVFYVVPDSQRAMIYAEAWEAGKNSVRPVIREKIIKGKTVYVVEPDLESQVAANYMVGLLDSVISENEKYKDIVMYDVIDSTRFRLEMVARWGERSFRGTKLTINDIPNVKSEPTFWDRWSFGPSIGVYLIGVSPGDNIKFLGANIGVNLTYDLLK